MATDSADDINVGVALSTALLLPGDLEKNTGMSEYENYAFMLQHCVQAVQHAHSFSMQSFENREKLTDLQKEYSALQKINKGLQAKKKKLEDQAEAATKAQTLAEEKAEAAEAIKKVAKAQKNEAEEKATQAEKELQEALATKKAETKEADEKAYAQGMADVLRSTSFKLDLPADSPFRNADAIPLPFPTPPPSQAEEESGSEPEDEDDHDAEALMKKAKDDAGVRSPSRIEPILDLTQDEEVEEVPKEVDIGTLSSDLLLAERSLTKTLTEIDAELAAEKAAEVVPQEPAEVFLQESDEVQTQILSEAEKS
ncbi:uncharacterized abhydrolase domain-containing protein DDB_G0269086-like [Camellia sinensis]|uniref:uncharacterized abhydrolase domain-containing protein DDB_G0269086-like n=1 Tax=Camellia sinensis TaxID=4442 RepID=UPI001035DF95|nr:uncharacterized abhydrolase domain-containing protein DDB_G0269086-like [Camellia sinensis]